MVPFPGQCHICGMRLYAWSGPPQLSVVLVPRTRTCQVNDALYVNLCLFLCTGLNFCPPFNNHMYHCFSMDKNWSSDLYFKISLIGPLLQTRNYKSPEMASSIFAFLSVCPQAKRSQFLTQEPNFLKIWSLGLHQEKFLLFSKLWFLTVYSFFRVFW